MYLEASIIKILSSYQIPAILLGTFFFGETVIITAAFLSTRGIWSPIDVFWLSLVGTTLSDSLWFFFGQYLLDAAHRWEKYQPKYRKLADMLEKISGKRPFVSLLFIKFLYGTRILTIIYLSLREIRFSIFLIFDTLGTIFWLAVMILIGWLAGKGIADIIPIFNKLEYALLVLVLLLIIVKIISLWARKKTIKG